MLYDKNLKSSKVLHYADNFINCPMTISKIPSLAYAMFSIQ